MKRAAYVTFSSQLPSESKLTKIGRNIIIGDQIDHIIGNFTNILKLTFFQLGSPTRTRRSHAWFAKKPKSFQLDSRIIACGWMWRGWAGWINPTGWFQPDFSQFCSKSFFLGSFLNVLTLDLISTDFHTSNSGVVHFRLKTHSHKNLGRLLFASLSSRGRTSRQICAGFWPRRVWGSLRRGGGRARRRWEERGTRRGWGEGGRKNCGLRGQGWGRRRGGGAALCSRSSQLGYRTVPLSMRSALETSETISVWAIKEWEEGLSARMLRTWATTNVSATAHPTVTRDIIFWLEHWCIVMQCSIIEISVCIWGGLEKRSALWSEGMELSHECLHGARYARKTQATLGWMTVKLTQTPNRCF